MSGPRDAMNPNRKGVESSWRILLDDDHYCLVFVWEDKETFWKNHPEDKHDGALGLCLGHIMKIKYDENGNEISRISAKKFSEIHLIRDEIGSGYVAHELQHLVLFWSDFMKWSYENGDMEKICRIAEHITRDFWNEFYERYTFKGNLKKAKEVVEV